MAIRRIGCIGQLLFLRNGTANSQILTECGHTKLTEGRYHNMAQTVSEMEQWL